MVCIVLVYIFINTKIIIYQQPRDSLSLYICVCYNITSVLSTVYNSFKNTHDSKVHGSFKVQSTLFRNFHLACFSIICFCISFCYSCVCIKGDIQCMAMRVSPFFIWVRKSRTYRRFRDFIL